VFLREAIKSPRSYCSCRVAALLPLLIGPKLPAPTDSAKGHRFAELELAPRSLTTQCPQPVVIATRSA